MADFYFYTDLNLLSPQTKEQCFGPVESADSDYSSGEEKFRVTNRHIATADPLAYAVCNGTVLAVKNTSNTNLITLILKPSIQDSKIFPRVKYFVYRGVRLDSLISGSGTSEIITSTIDNTFTKFVNDKIATKSSTILLGDISNPSFDPFDSLDNFYFSNSQSQFVEVDGGWSIGRFHKDFIGFEIILDTVNEKTQYSSFANEVSYVINTHLGTGEIDQFKALTIKQGIHNYLDPCAFYGNFLQDNHFVWARSSTDTIDSDLKPKYIHDPGNSSVPDNKKTDFKIYTELLNASNILFWNRNKTYVDIRNELNFSFNYMKNYTFINSSSVEDNTLLFTSFDNQHKDTLEERVNNPAENILKIDYYRSGWPLLWLDENTDILNASLNTKNHLYFSFPKGDNRQPLAFVEFANIKKNSNLQFLDLGYRKNGDNYYTPNNLVLETVNYTNGSSNEICCSYIRIKYLKLFKPDQVSSNGVLRQEKYFDIIFPFEINIPFENHSDTIKYVLKGDEVLIDPALYQSGSGPYMAQIGRAIDSKYVTYYSIATQELKKPKPRKGNHFHPFPFSSGKTDLQDYFLIHLAAKGKNSLAPQLITFPAAGIQIQIQKFIRDDQGILTSVSYKNDEDPYDLNQTVLAFCIPYSSDPALDVYNMLVAAAIPYTNDNIPVFLSVTAFNDEELDVLNQVTKFAKLAVELKTFDLTGSSLQILSIPNTQFEINGYNSRKI